MLLLSECAFKWVVNPPMQILENACWKIATWVRVDASAMQHAQVRIGAGARRAATPQLPLGQIPSNRRKGTIASKYPSEDTSGDKCPSYTSAVFEDTPSGRDSAFTLRSISVSISRPISFLRFTSTSHSERLVCSIRSTWTPGLPLALFAARRR